MKTKSNSSFILGPVFFVCITLFISIHPIFSKYSYQEINLINKNKPPSTEHWFGTDELGRDLLIRTTCGARTSLTIGVITACTELIIGIIWAGCASMISKNVENIMMRISEIFYAIPKILLVLLIMMIIKPGSFIGLIIGLSIGGWISFANILKNEFIKIQSLEFIAVSKSFGASNIHILRKHILPNITGLIIVTSIMSIPRTIFAESFLSFMGFGITPPKPALGAMISSSLSGMTFFPWRMFFPAIVITIFVITLNITGSWLNSIFEQDQKERL